MHVVTQLHIKPDSAANAIKHLDGFAHVLARIKVDTSRSIFWCGVRCCTKAVATIATTLATNMGDALIPVLLNVVAQFAKVFAVGVAIDGHTFATFAAKQLVQRHVCQLALDIPKSHINTGLGFFDHMLEQVARHGLFDLRIQVQGDLHIDEHHTIEDVAITLGEVFNKALTNKKGIERYGFLLPMDDCLAQVAIDFGGRPWLVWDATFTREKIGDMPTEMFLHFFKSFSDHARCNLNIKAEGTNEHHKIESIFKAFARAAASAVRRTDHSSIPSTKGIL